jgi:hypothetical protein
MYKVGDKVRAVNPKESSKYIGRIYTVKKLWPKGVTVDRNGIPMNYFDSDVELYDPNAPFKYNVCDIVISLSGKNHGLISGVTTLEHYALQIQDRSWRTTSNGRTPIYQFEGYGHLDWIPEFLLRPAKFKVGDEVRIASYNTYKTNCGPDCKGEKATISDVRIYDPENTVPIIQYMTTLWPDKKGRCWRWFGEDLLELVGGSAPQVHGPICPRCTEIELLPPGNFVCGECGYPGWKALPNACTHARYRLVRGAEISSDVIECMKCEMRFRMNQTLIARDVIKIVKASSAVDHPHPDFPIDVTVFCKANAPAPLAFLRTSDSSIIMHLPAKSIPS